jgi:hypothetical protein
MPLVVLLVVALLFTLEGLLERDPPFMLVGGLLFGFWIVAAYLKNKSKTRRTELIHALGSQAHIGATEAGKSETQAGLPGPHPAACSMEEGEEDEKTTQVG